MLSKSELCCLDLLLNDALVWSRILRTEWSRLGSDRTGLSQANWMACQSSTLRPTRVWRAICWVRELLGSRCLCQHWLVDRVLWGTQAIDQCQRRGILDRAGVCIQGATGGTCECLATLSGCIAPWLVRGICWENIVNGRQTVRWQGDTHSTQRWSVPRGTTNTCVTCVGVRLHVGRLLICAGHCSCSGGTWLSRSRHYAIRALNALKRQSASERGVVRRLGWRAWGLHAWLCACGRLVALCEQSENFVRARNVWERSVVRVLHRAQKEGWKLPQSECQKHDTTLWALAALSVSQHVLLFPVPLHITISEANCICLAKLSITNRKPWP